MLNDYKGEKPNNVITEEEHKKRPFYKKVSFWVLSALGLFFGACSVYGLVLGYQYVHAVTEAAHIIADANDSSDPEKVSSLKKNRAFAGSVGDVACVDLGTIDWTKVGNDRFATTYFYNGKAVYPSSDSVAPEIICSAFTTDTASHVYWNETENTITLGSGGSCFVYITDDYYANHSVEDFVSFVSGVYLYYKLGVSGETAQEHFTQEGYDVGYEDGHQDGYQEGYDDGYQALAGVQNVRILFDENFPTLNPINYSWKVDGQDVASGQIMLRPNQSAPVVNLTRPAGYAHKAELNIWSENDQPLVLAYGRHEGLVIGGTQTYIYDTYNKSNAYDWANSVWYVPTYNPNTGFLIYSYGTAQQGYTNDYFFEFDPEHNDRAKTGIYADGYDQGYKDGTESGTAYDNGYGAGYDQGYDDGMTIGKAQGEAQAVGGQKALVTMFVTAFQQPFDQIYRFLNFNVLGLNILALFTALLTLSIGIIIIKKVI